MSKIQNKRAGRRIPASISSLYQLIGVLTPAQKRDFKKYTQFWDYSGSRKYLALFDMVNLCIREGKDKDALMERLASDGFDNSGRLASMARYLYSKILESVRLKQDVSPLTNRLLNMLQDINFLFYKRLYDDCEQLIMEAKKLAQTLDKSTYLMELSLWERRLYVTGRTVKEQSKRVREIAEEEKNLLQDISCYLDLNTLSNDLYLSLKEGSATSDYAENSVNELLLQNEEELLERLSLRAKYWYYNSLYHYYESLHKQQKPGVRKDNAEANLYLALDCLEKIFELSESEGRLLSGEEPSLFNSFIDNYILMCLRLAEFDRISRFEQKMLASENDVQFYRGSVYFRLIYQIRKNQFVEARKIISENNLDRQLPLFENRIEENRMLTMKYYCGLTYFILEDYKNVSEWHGKILGGPRFQANPMMLLTIELQHIVSLFELGVFKKKPTRPLDNFQNKLRRRKEQDVFYNRLIFALKSIFEPKIPVIREELKAQNELLRDLMKENGIYESYFSPLVAWMEAKVNGTTVAEEIVKYQ